MKNKTQTILVGMVFVLAIIAVSLMIIETNQPLPQEERNYAEYISLVKTEDAFGIPIKQTPFGYFEKIDPEKIYYYMVNGEIFGITGEQLEGLI